MSNLVVSRPAASRTCVCRSRRPASFIPDRSKVKSIIDKLAPNTAKPRRYLAGDEMTLRVVKAKSVGQPAKTVVLESCELLIRPGLEFSTVTRVGQQKVLLSVWQRRQMPKAWRSS